MQGLSTGGEFGAGTTYLAEIAPPGKRGTYSSFYYITDTLGTMMAVATSFALRSLLQPGDIHAWGWRIPFILGAILGIIGFVVRRSIAESEVFMDSEKIAKPRLLDAIRLHPRASLQVFGITAGATAWFYTFGIYLPSYAKVQNEGGSRAIDIATLIAEAVFCIALPFFGAFSDRFGRRLSALLFYGIATVAAIPLFLLFTPSAAVVFAIQTLGLLIFAFYGSIAPTLMSEMFPTEVRAAGLGFPYAVAVALIGGTAPYVLELLSKNGSGIMFAVYLTALSFISFVVAWSLRDRRHDDLRNI
ncbi:major facilitator superfamily protein [Mycolicibacterium brisbanense]|uniref:Major facilitator superfamily protein n=2 Tax=Mycolicibacterium brisbanense TaxID=146020 RepID=A0A124DZQ1_9MYCO|nr:major facilitator superfamily protein [Mycolicibacterium brisbanense]